MAKINSTTIVTKQCISCGSPMDIKIFSNCNHPEYGNPIVKHKSKIACSHSCHTNWQRSISQEERIGTERATEIRKCRSEDSSNNNPSTRPGVAEKISKSLKAYLAITTDARSGENNPFYGKSHTPELKQHWKETKKGKWSYNEEQKLSQSVNSPKKENHPNWQGGIANGEYGAEFTKELKEAIKETYNNICQLCKIGGVDLDVHHVDYNKKNNVFNNLIPLCKTCHGKTNFNREKWKTLFEGKVD